jgi:hypothetical protein
MSVQQVTTGLATMIFAATEKRGHLVLLKWLTP